MKFVGFTLLGLLGLFTSCSGVKSIAVSTTGSVLYDATYAMERENSWENFEKAVLGNLAFVEGLLYLDPENEELLTSAIKGYTGYAFAINETLFLNDQLAENDLQINKKAAIHNFSKALKYGIQFLKFNNIEYMQLVRAAKEKNGIKSLLDKELSSEKLSYEAVLFSAQALASLINLQKDKMTMVGQLPVAKSLFDWVCEKDPTISFGACDIFYGAYYAGRPKIFGGDPAKGKAIFLNLIKNNPKNWLARVAYMQFYLIPLADEDGHKEQSFFLEKFLHYHNQERIWNPIEKDYEQMFGEKNLRIYQTIAIERYKIIKKYQKDLF